MRKYVCSVCGYVYDEAKGIPEAGIAPGKQHGKIFQRIGSALSVAQQKQNLKKHGEPDASVDINKKQYMITL